MAVRLPVEQGLHCEMTKGAEREFQRGVLEFANRNLIVAIGAFNGAESLGYNRNECAAYRWQCWMLLVRFEDAWRESDLISARSDPDPHALWDGRPFEDERVIVRCLHGYGDAIQFIRYAETVRRSAARVIVETHPEMVTLLARVPFVDDVIAWATATSLPRDTWDRQIEVTELPRAFRTTVATIPGVIPYIHVTQEAQARSRRLLGEPRGFKVGLVWASSMWNPARCIRLAELEPVLQCEGCAFYSFQRGLEREQMSNYALHDTSLHSPEIVDTAADLLNMELLITVDTMAAHLAGALGKPVWTLLPYEADWRWMLDREDTPWYPTMRLFRQEIQGEWGPVVSRLARELLAFRDTTSRP
jgi:hypothetical protein